VKFEGDRSNPLEVIITQTQEFGKAIRPIFADQVKYGKCIWLLIGTLSKE